MFSALFCVGPSLAPDKSRRCDAKLLLRWPVVGEGGAAQFYCGRRKGKGQYEGSVFGLMFQLAVEKTLTVFCQGKGPCWVFWWLYHLFTWLWCPFHNCFNSWFHFPGIALLVVRSTARPVGLTAVETAIECLSTFFWYIIYVLVNLFGIFHFVSCANYELL